MHKFCKCISGTLLLIGQVNIPDGLNFILNSDNQFTLTCISIGGPATSVQWTRDSTVVTEGTETILNDPVTAQYTHTLTVTGRLDGVYTCTVTNKVSRDSAQFIVQGELKLD